MERESKNFEPDLLRLQFLVFVFRVFGIPSANTARLQKIGKEAGTKPARVDDSTERPELCRRS